eukprot:2903148-Pleurochrysis_carterae.AAC.8
MRWALNNDDRNVTLLSLAHSHFAAEARPQIGKATECLRASTRQPRRAWFERFGPHDRIAPRAAFEPRYCSSHFAANTYQLRAFAFSGRAL